jgi:hypothetical protein
MRRFHDARRSRAAHGRSVPSTRDALPGREVFRVVGGDDPVLQGDCLTVTVK